MDLGDRFDIHPKFKMEVGRRLCLLALGHVYDEDILCDPPAPQTMTAIWDPLGQAAESAGKTILITLRFSNTGLGLHTDGPIAGDFDLYLGQDRLNVTEAHVEADCLFLKAFCSRDTLSHSPSGRDQILRISYLDRDYCTAHLYASNGLPARPFRESVLLRGVR